MGERILVAGGTGTTGRRVVGRLGNAGVEVAIGTRRPSGPRDRRFDWGDPASLAAFDGCSAVYLVAPTDRTDQSEVMRPVLAGAMARGARRFVLLSPSMPDRGGPMMGGVHAWLADNAPEWAVLRPSWFMPNFSGGPSRRDRDRRASR